MLKLLTYLLFNINKRVLSMRTVFKKMLELFLRKSWKQGEKESVFWLTD